MFLQELITPETFRWFDKLTGAFATRLGVDLLSVVILVRFIYYRQYRRSDLFLTYFAFNLIIFLITYLLNQVEMSMGAAFGLFAVFSMLRYRTEGISAKDMTYLFLVIAIGLISAISQGGWDDLALLSAIMLLVTYLLESGLLMKREHTKIIQYDNIHLIPTHRRDELLADLKVRTGLDIHRVEIQEIDFLKDSALMTVYYH